MRAALDQLPADSLRSKRLRQLLGAALGDLDEQEALGDFSAIEVIGDQVYRVVEGELPPSQLLSIDVRGGVVDVCVNVHHIAYSSLLAANGELHPSTALLLSALA